MKYDEAIYNAVNASPEDKFTVNYETEAKIISWVEADFRTGSANREKFTTNSNQIFTYVYKTGT